MHVTASSLHLQQEYVTSIHKRTVEKVHFHLTASAMVGNFCGFACNIELPVTQCN